MNAGIDPKMAALTVGTAASNTFVLTTHQVNALIMRPGGYKPADCVKAGTGMTIIYMMWSWWPCCSSILCSKDGSDPDGNQIAFIHIATGAGGRPDGRPSKKL